MRKEEGIVIIDDNTIYEIDTKCMNVRNLEKSHLQIIILQMKQRKKKTEKIVKCGKKQFNPEKGRLSKIKR